MTDHQHTAAVLNQAADHIQAHGLHQGDAYGLGDVRTAPMCTVGAITHADIALGDYQAANTVAAIAAVREYIGTRSIIDWSDATVRTASEVVEVLRAAAVIEQAHADRKAVTT